MLPAIGINLRAAETQIATICRRSSTATSLLDHTMRGQLYLSRRTTYCCVSPAVIDSLYRFPHISIANTRPVADLQSWRRQSQTSSIRYRAENHVASVESWTRCTRDFTSPGVNWLQGTASVQGISSPLLFQPEPRPRVVDTGCSQAVLCPPLCRHVSAPAGSTKPMLVLLHFFTRWSKQILHIRPGKLQIIRLCTMQCMLGCQFRLLVAAPVAVARAATKY
jgi:hypothetical protein